LELLKGVSDLEEVALGKEEFVVLLVGLGYSVIRIAYWHLPMMVSTGKSRASSLKYSLRLPA
jgi:hypothetical protein